MWTRRTAVITGVLASAALAAVFAFDLTPWVRGGFGWRWEYNPVAYPALGYTLLLSLYVLLAWLLLRRSARAPFILTLAFLAAAVLPLAAAGLRDGDILYTMFGRTFSQVASAHHWGSTQINWASGEWRDWTAMMARLGSHVATSPPALPAAYAISGALIDRVGLSVPLARPLLAALCTDYQIYDLTATQVASGWFGVLSPVWSALTVFPLYILAKRSGARAEIAVLLWPLVPGISAFAGSNSTLFPFFAVMMLAPLAGGFTMRRFAAGGLAFGVATFSNFALLPLAGMAGYFALVRWFIGSPRQPFLSIVKLGAVFAAAALLPWLVWFALSGETPLDLLRQSFDAHLVLERPYTFWVWFHVWDWAVWGGVAVVAAALIGARYNWRERVSNPNLAALTAALILTLLTLTISGITRGESGRIWLFLVPFALVILARADFNPSASWLPLGFSQAMLTFALIFAVDAFNAPDVPPRPALETVLSASGTPLATFTGTDGGRFRLMSASIAQPDKLILTLQGDTPTLAPVWFGLIAVDAEGNTIAAEPQQPQQQEMRLPSSCLVSGTQAQVALVLPDISALNNDSFYISLSAYGFRQGDPALSVTTPDGTETQVGLGPFSAAP